MEVTFDTDFTICLSLTQQNVASDNVTTCAIKFTQLISTAVLYSVASISSVQKVK